MIRLEHSTGIMMERFNDLSVKVENDLSTMKQEFNAITSQAKGDQEHYKKIAEGKSVLLALYTYVIKKHTQKKKKNAMVGKICVYVTGPTFYCGFRY